MGRYKLSPNLVGADRSLRSLDASDGAPKPKELYASISFVVAHIH